jgi:hypothetical protein
MWDIPCFHAEITAGIPAALSLGGTICGRPVSIGPYRDTLRAMITSDISILCLCITDLFRFQAYAWIIGHISWEITLLGADRIVILSRREKLINVKSFSFASSTARDVAEPTPETIE